jgi:hypothetical protein
MRALPREDRGKDPPVYAPRLRPDGRRHQMNDVHHNVWIVQGDDQEEFASRLMEALSQTTTVDDLPLISFSHTAVDGGFHYMAIVMGRTPEGKVTIHDHLRRHPE